MPRFNSEQSHASVESFAIPPRDREFSEGPSGFENVPELEMETPKVPLSHYVWLLRRHLWKIVAFVSACMLITFIVSARLKPLYESTATIDIDLQAPDAVVGQGSTTPMNTEDPDVFFPTQIRLIESDAVLRPVAEQFNLLRNNAGPFNPSSLASQSAANAPVSLSGLRVVRPVNTYLLLISYRASDPRLAANVANAIANSYVAHTYELRIRSSANMSSFMSQQLDELKAKMERSNMALAQFEKDMDVVNPEEKTNILSARLLQLNTEYTNAQADRINKQAAWDAAKAGSLEVSADSPQGRTMADLSIQLHQAQERLAVVKATYGVRHPEYRKASSDLAEVKRQYDKMSKSVSDQIETDFRQSQIREQMLADAVSEAKDEWDKINARSFQYQQLKQEATADKALYDELTTKIHEAGINAGFKDNNIRIADIARPSATPVYPNKRQNVFLAFLFSSFLAIGGVVFLDSLDTTLRSPEEASRFLGTDVIGTLPLDKSISPVPKTPGTRAETTAAFGSAQAVGDTVEQSRGPYRAISGFEEAVRTVRNTILLSDFDQRLRSIVLTSAEPAEGKTTLAVYLAIANADRGKKTLLVDGDLRRPSLHSRFGLTPSEGLSDVLNGHLPWKDAILPVEGRPNLALLPAGPGSHRAADLIGPHLADLLDEFARQFDLVILDAPPLPGFAECLQMAVAADGVLIVSRAGETKRKSVAAVVSTLRRLRTNVIGVVMNCVTHKTSDSGYAYYGYNQKGYTHAERPDA
jgi:polysaccharide biosynthesis transport protein